jgi:hypothetical protein
MNTQHTLGPWVVLGGNIRRVSANGDTTEPVLLDDPANARLIAAAPELLSALRELMEYTGGWDSSPDHPCGIGRDALVAATGEQF